MARNANRPCIFTPNARKRFPSIINPGILSNGGYQIPGRYFNAEKTRPQLCIPESHSVFDQDSEVQEVPSVKGRQGVEQESSKKHQT